MVAMIKMSPLISQNTRVCLSFIVCNLKSRQNIIYILPMSSFLGKPVRKILIKSLHEFAVSMQIYFTPAWSIYHSVPFTLMDYYIMIDKGLFLYKIRCFVLNSLQEFWLSLFSWRQTSSWYDLCSIHGTCN